MTSEVLGTSEVWVHTTQRGPKSGRLRGSHPQDGRVPAAAGRVVQGWRFFPGYRAGRRSGTAAVERCRENCPVRAGRTCSWTDTGREPPAHRNNASTNAAAGTRVAYCNDGKAWAGPLLVRNQESEVRGQKSEVRTQRSELRGQNSGVRGQMSEVRTEEHATTLCPLSSDF